MIDTHEISRPIEQLPYDSVLTKLADQQATHGTRIVGFADIDDTTYSHRHPEMNGPAYAQTLEGHHVPDMRITGRHFPEVIDYINQGMVTAIPDAIGSRNGTMIYTPKPEAFTKHAQGTPVTSEDFILDPIYQKMIADLGFSKRDILAATPAFFAEIHNHFPEVWLEHQIADRGDNLETWGMVTDRNQVIYDIEAPEGTDLNALQAFIDTFAQQNFAGLATILMENGKAKQSGMQGAAYGLFVLPPGIGKHTAIEYLIEQTQASAGFYLGDQLNDSTALAHTSYTVPMYRGVVGGASPLLHAKLGHDPHEQKRWRRFAQGHRDLICVENDMQRIGPVSATHMVTEIIKREHRKAAHRTH